MKIRLIITLFLSTSINLFSQYNQVSLDTALAKSINYFQEKKGNTFPKYSNLFLYYFQKKYDVDFHLNITQLRNQFSDTSSSQEIPAPYSRLIGVLPNYISEKQIDSFYQTYDSLMLRALYYDKIPISKKTIVQLLKKRLKDPEPFSISHGLVALSWLVENNFQYSLTHKYLKKYSKKGIYIIQNNQCADLDTYMELVNFLVYHHQGTQYYNSWLEHVIRYQNEDGGWPKEFVVSAPSYDHCSMFGIWFLLQMTHQNQFDNYDWLKLTK